MLGDQTSKNSKSLWQVHILRWHKMSYLPEPTSTDMQVDYIGVNTQTQTYAQIHAYTQIPAFFQLPILFQRRVLSQSSAHPCRSQAPCPAMSSADPPSSAETTPITCRLCTISVGGNRAATWDLASAYTLATGRWLCWKDHSPSSVFFSSHPHSSTVPVSTSPTLIIPALLDPRSCDVPVWIISHLRSF